LNNIYIGKVLKHDIYNSHGMLVIPKESTLNKEHMVLLQKQQIQITDKDIESLGSEKLITRATQEIYDIFSRMKTEGQIPVQDIQSQVLPFVSHVTESPDLHEILAGLQTKDDYTYRHNIGVAVFSNMIGKWLHLPAEELAELTIAATLHDVGKIHIPDAILNKPGRFTDEEFEQMKKHALYGYDILKDSRELSDRIKLVALQHHERFDGSGYPYGIHGDQMEYFSKIVAVADIYHALTTNRVYRKSMPYYKVMQIMEEESYGRLDNHITSLFMRRIMEMAVGSMIQLTDGRVGKIIMLHPHFLARPLIEMEGAYIDLSKGSELQIETFVEMTVP
jgi:HD-GYP domain-containing protein (c-di-GMP phosphodiesterase class II)